MKPIEENIESLSRAIMSDAHREAEEVIAEAKDKADATLQQAKQQAEEARKEILDRASQEAARIRSQKIASTQLKARTMQLESREKLLDQVYQTALEELPSVQQWTDYEEIARNLLREAVQLLKTDNVLIRADQHTLSHLPEQFLNDLSKEQKVEVKPGETLDHGTGVVIEATNGHLQYDNTLETRLQRTWNATRSQVFHLLMGETL